MASPQSGMKRKRDTPPASRPGTPEYESTPDVTHGYATPPRTSSSTPDTVPQTPPIPPNLTQAIVDANPELKRFQQDLLILTSHNETSTLHWRPSWFAQDSHAKNFWTLYNPPNVVTELPPGSSRSRMVYMRRMRRAGDRYASYIKDWEHWERYCALRGVPVDFLCEAQVELTRLGLRRDAVSEICAPPLYPLYPEPQPPNTGRYLLNPSTYKSHLLPKFHGTKTAGADDEIEVVVVHSNGALKVEQREIFFQHASQWTHYDGRGGYTDDRDIVGELGAPKDQRVGRRWSWLPWTGGMEGSCGVERCEEEVEEEMKREEGVLKIKLRLKTSGMKGGNTLCGKRASEDGPRKKKARR